MQVDGFLCGPHSEQMVEAGGYWEKLEDSAAGCRVEVKGGFVDVKGGVLLWSFLVEWLLMNGRWRR